MLTFNCPETSYLISHQDEWLSLHFTELLFQSAVVLESKLMRASIAFSPQPRMIETFTKLVIK